MNASLRAFAAPAGPSAALWRLMAGLTLIAALLAGGALLIAAALRWLDISLPAGGAPGALAGLTTFILWWAALAAALRLLHRRGLRSIFGPPRAGRLRRFALGMGGAAVFSGLGLAVGAAVLGAPAPSGLAPGPWALGVAAGAPLILIQAGAEEALFRGYIMQQLAARFASPLIWCAAPSLLFGLLHWSPGAGAAAMVASAACLGAALAVATAWSGDLFAAWGLHFGVNLAAILLVAPSGHFSGLALFHWPGGAGLSLLAWADLGLVAVAALGALGLSRFRRAG